MREPNKDCLSDEEMNEHISWVHQDEFHIGRKLKLWQSIYADLKRNWEKSPEIYGDLIAWETAFALRNEDITEYYPCDRTIDMFLQVRAMCLKKAEMYANGFEASVFLKDRYDMLNMRYNSKTVSCEITGPLFE